MTNNSNQKKDFRFWLLEGWSAKDPEYARECFQKAIELTPSDQSSLEVQAWLSKVLSQRGALPEPSAAVNGYFTDAAAAAEVERSRGLGFIAFIYLILIAIAEVLSVLLPLTSYGLTFHGLLLAALLMHSAFTPTRQEQRLYLTLSFAPLIRLVSLTLPLQNVPTMYWYFIIGVPLFMAFFLVIRYAGFTQRHIGLTWRKWFLQLLFGLLGIGLGYLEYLILAPQPMAASFSWQQLWVPALILFIFTGLLEELIFRGLMQAAFTSALGVFWGLVYVSLIFAILHIGYQSLLDVLFVFAVAIIFGVFTRLTGSILGVTIAHGLTNIFLFLVFPFFIGNPGQPLWSGSDLSLVSPPPVSSPTPFMALSAVPTASPSAAVKTRVSPTALPSQVPAVSPSSSPAPVSLTIDDGESGFLRTGGSWWQTPQGFQGDLIWSFSVKQDPDTLIVWSLSLPRCGRYAVQVFIPADFGTSRSVDYRVSHRDGQAQVVLDQNQHQGVWADLGEFWFDVDQAASVAVSNATGEEDGAAMVVFDAARWTLVDICQ